MTSGVMPTPVSATVRHMKRTASFPSSGGGSDRVDMVTVPPFRHRIARINAQIEDGIFKLVAINQNRPQPCIETQLEAHGLANRSAKEFSHPADQLIHICHCRVKRLPP